MALYYLGGRITRYEFVAALHDLPANQDPQSHSLAWGTEPRPGETRHLLIGIAFQTLSGVEPDTLTVGGAAASRLVGHAPTGVFTVGQAFWIVEKPNGTSGTIAFGVPSGDIDGGMIAVWAAYNLLSPAAVDTAASPAAGAGTTDVSLDVALGGAVFAVASMSNTTTRSVNWTGITEVSANETIDDQQWAASEFDLAAAAPRSITANWLAPGAFTVSIVAVSLR